MGPEAAGASTGARNGTRARSGTPSQRGGHPGSTTRPIHPSWRRRKGRGGSSRAIIGPGQTPVAGPSGSKIDGFDHPARTDLCPQARCAKAGSSGRQGGHAGHPARAYRRAGHIG